MDLSTLSAISPIDGRYRHQVSELSSYFSEYALIRYRLQIEVEYFITLCQLPLPQLSAVNPAIFPELRQIYSHFNPEAALRIKEIEKTTNHDIKAVEYFLKERFEQLQLAEYSEFVHFGLTSQDINNTAFPRSLADAFAQTYLPALEQLTFMLSGYAKDWETIPMLAHTHGQPASPTRLGKEIQVFVSRLEEQVAGLKNIPFAAKFGGATGNMNAHYAAYPQTNWHQFATDFVEQNLQLKRSYPTTQIEHYDYLAAFCDACKRINTILIDLCRDFWTYISMEYFRQKIKAGEVGSSAMPHKVNPIDFENAEGNFGVANALYTHLSEKLPISRLQRDLTDSTVLRNMGVPMAHGLLAIKSLQKGLSKLILNPAALDADLDANWAVVAEGIQTILRRECYPKPYEALKALTRTHEQITRESLRQFIMELKVSDSVKQELLALTPFTYLGR